jgi:hypothetical protein
MVGRRWTVNGEKQRNGPVQVKFEFTEQNHIAELAHK